MADPLIGFTMDLSDIQDMRSRGSAATGTDSDQVARGGLGSQCFPIAELDQDWNGEPQDGMEYLFTVRRQAQSHPKVTRVPNPYEDLYSDYIPPKQPRERLNKPNNEWKNAFLRNFHALRYRMNTAPSATAFPPPTHSQLPLPQDQTAWKMFINGRKLKTPLAPTLNHSLATTVVDDPSPPVDTSLEDAKAAALASLDLDTPDLDSEVESTDVTAASTDLSSIDPERPAHHPTPSLLLSIPTPHLIRVLSHFDDWLQERLEAHEMTIAYVPSTIFAPMAVRRKAAAAATRIPTAAAPTSAPVSAPATVMPRPPLPTIAESHWMLSILTRVDSLLMSDDISTLRQLAKTLTLLADASDKAQTEREKRMGGMTGGRTAEERLWDEEDAEGRAHCWMIVAAISSAWSQNDLWEDV